MFKATILLAILANISMCGYTPRKYTSKYTPKRDPCDKCRGKWYKKETKTESDFCRRCNRDYKPDNCCAKVSALQAENDRLRCQLEDALRWREKAERLQKEVDELREVKYELERCQCKVRDLQEELECCQRENADLKKELELQADQIKRLEERVSELECLVRELEEKLECCQRENAELKEKNDWLREKNEALEKENCALKDRIEELECRIRDLEYQLENKCNCKKECVWVEKECGCKVKEVEEELKWCYKEEKKCGCKAAPYPKKPFSYSKKTARKAYVPRKKYIKIGSSM